MSRIEVTVTYAILKKSYELFGKMDNFVRVKVLGGGNSTAEYKTNIIKGDKNAKIVWNETLTIPLKAGPQLYLEFTVYDQDMTTNDVCGIGLLNLNTTGAFVPGVPNKFNIRLHNGEKDEEITGELHVTTRFL